MITFHTFMGHAGSRGGEERILVVFVMGISVDLQQRAIPNHCQNMGEYACAIPDFLLMMRIHKMATWEATIHCWKLAWVFNNRSPHGSIRSLCEITVPLPNMMTKYAR